MMNSVRKRGINLYGYCNGSEAAGLWMTVVLARKSGKVGAIMVWVMWAGKRENPFIIIKCESSGEKVLTEALLANRISGLSMRP